MVVFGLYANAIPNPFIIDDGLAIQRHPDVLHVDGVFQLWFHDYWDGLGEDPNLYRPITILSYSVNRLFTGMEPSGFRVVNIALLGCLGWMLGVWLTRRMHVLAAWGAALLFVIHPSNTEVINHVVGRADLLSLTGIFGFLLLQSRTWGPWRMALASLCAIVAIGSKESGLALIPLAAANHFLLAGQKPQTQVLPSKQPQSARVKWTSSWIPVVCVGGPLLLYALGRIHAVGLGYQLPVALGNDLTGNPLRGMTFLERLPASLSIFAEYFRLSVWPLTAFNHVPAEIPTWSSPVAWLGAVLLLIMTASLVVAARSRTHRWLLIPLGLALCQWLIVGNLLAPTGVYVANRLTLGFTICTLSLLAWIADEWFQWDVALPTPMQRKLIALAPVAFIFPLMILGTFRANKAWSSELNRMQNDLVQEPSNPVAMYHLGVALAFAEKFDVSKDWLLDAVKLRPDSLQARMDLASVYLKQSTPEFDAAKSQYLFVIEHGKSATPTMLGLACKNLGAMAIMNRQFDAAQTELEEAYRQTPRDPDVLYNLGQCATGQGRYVDAIKYYETLLEMSPKHEAGRKAYEQLKAALANH
jgi:cytochrome c-type biogenesis protein CcmH/NrfG